MQKPGRVNACAAGEQHVDYHITASYNGMSSYNDMQAIEILKP